MKLCHICCIPLHKLINTFFTKNTSPYLLKLFSPRCSGYFVPAEVTYLIGVCMQSEEALRLQSTGTGSAKIERNKQYLSPLRLSLGDLQAARAASGCIFTGTKGLSCVFLQVHIAFTSSCVFWMLLMEDKQLFEADQG